MAKIMWLIYKITFSNDPERWPYIGETSDLKRRMREHKSDSRQHWDKLTPGGIAWAIKWLGTENMVVETLIDGITTQEEAFDLEEEYISQFDSWLGPGWNLAPGGEGIVGYVHTAETKAKMSKAKTGKKFTDEHKAKIGKASKGRKHTAEAKENMRKAQNRPEVKEKHQARPRDAHGQFISEANIGKPSQSWWDTATDEQRKAHAEATRRGKAKAKQATA